MSTLAGSGSSGSTDGLGTAASFAYPEGVCADAFGNIFVSDWNNHKIRKISSVITDIKTQKIIDSHNKIYPNPALGIFTVELFSNAQINVIDNLGKIILNQKISGEPATK